MQAAACSTPATVELVNAAARRSTQKQRPGQETLARHCCTRTCGACPRRQGRRRLAGARRRGTQRSSDGLVHAPELARRAVQHPAAASASAAAAAAAAGAAERRPAPEQDARRVQAAGAAARAPRAACAAGLNTLNLTLHCADAPAPPRVQPAAAATAAACRAAAAVGRAPSEAPRPRWRPAERAGLPRRPQAALPRQAAAARPAGHRGSLAHPVRPRLVRPHAGNLVSGMSNRHPPTSAPTSRQVWSTDLCQQVHREGRASACADMHSHGLHQSNCLVPRRRLFFIGP